MKLSFQLVDFVAEVSNYALVSADMEVDHFLVGLYSHLDVLSTVSVLESVDGLFILAASRGYSCNHDCLAISA